MHGSCDEKPVKLLKKKELILEASPPNLMRW